MFEDLKDFLKRWLKDSKIDESEELKKLWLQKRDFVKDLRRELEKSYDKLHNSYVYSSNVTEGVKENTIKKILPKSPFDWVERDVDNDISLQKRIFKLFLAPRYTPFNFPVFPYHPEFRKEPLYHLYCLEIYCAADQEQDRRQACLPTGLTAAFACCEALCAEQQADGNPQRIVEGAKRPRQYTHLVNDMPSILTERIDLVIAELTLWIMTSFSEINYIASVKDRTFKGKKAKWQKNWIDNSMYMSFSTEWTQRG